METKITFNNKNALFMAALSKKVNNYFQSNTISKKGNWVIHTKALLLFPLHIALYVGMLTTTNNFLNILFAILIGFTSALIGFNIMHDGSHGSFSNNKSLNKIMAYSANLMGVEAHFWNTKHNILHHTFTNIAGLDDDIEKHPFFRFCTQQEKKWFHKYQHYYWALLYPLSTIFWIFFADFKKYFSKKIIGDYGTQKMTLPDHIIFWITKIVHIVLFIVLPMITLGLPLAIACFFGMHVVLSYTLNIVFQLAHVVKGTSFASVHDDVIQTEWAIHQVQTTANFATKNKLITWLVGGLNFQVEHHLFPKICHIHYPTINKIVKETCNQFNVNYIENKTFSGAFQSHLFCLKELGK